MHATGRTNTVQRHAVSFIQTEPDMRAEAGCSELSVVVVAFVSEEPKIKKIKFNKNKMRAGDGDKAAPNILTAAAAAAPSL